MALFDQFGTLVLKNSACQETSVKFKIELIENYNKCDNKYKALQISIRKSNNNFRYWGVRFVEASLWHWRLPVFVAPLSLPQHAALRTLGRVGNKIPTCSGSCNNFVSQSTSRADLRDQRWVYRFKISKYYYAKYRASWKYKSGMYVIYPLRK